MKKEVDIVQPYYCPYRKTPLEHMCSDVIDGQESKVSIHFEDSPYQTNLSVTLY
jgi:hypothetical protein